MNSSRAILTLFIATVGCASTVFAQDKPLKIGVIADMSGLYADMTGMGSVNSVEMAVQDFGGKLGERRIEIVTADHQNKADIASAIVRKWFTADEVDVVVNAAGSAVALAVTEVSKSTNKAALITGAVSDRLSNEACTPNHVHYGIDNYALVHGTVGALMGQGKKSWYFVVADYAFGQSFLSEATPFIQARGGTVLGSVKHPLNSADMSSFLLQAQSSKAEVVALANGGSDTVTAVRQAQEFGLQKGGQDVAAMIGFLTDIHAMGLPTAQGLMLTTPAYWDLDDRSRAFSERFFKTVGRMPTFYQQADYSATLAYLRAALKVGSADGTKVISEMKGKPIDDMFAQGGYIREDGLLIHDVYLAKVKTPEASKRPWDYLEIIATIPGERAFRPISESRCPLIKK